MAKVHNAEALRECASVILPLTCQLLPSLDVDSHWSIVNNKSSCTYRPCQLGCRSVEIV